VVVVKRAVYYLGLKGSIGLQYVKKSGEKMC
jgi:hypothetical protein